MRADLRRLRRDSGSARSLAADAASASAPAAASPAAVGLRRSGLWVGAAVAAVLLVVGGVWLARRGGEGTKPPADSVSGEKLIAVLPFENLGAQEDAYFADGMTDEVRAKLAGLPGLAVIASTSSSQYKEAAKPAEQIAAELGVRFLLLAKIRWQKNEDARRIRVSPELVEVAGGAAPTTRWQQAFDAELSDVFEVQADIARQVAKSLEVVLSDEQQGQLGKRPTSNLAAYESYLRGLDVERQGSDPSTLLRAVAQYEQAVALDPAFALAWACLASTRATLFFNGGPAPGLAEGAGGGRAGARVVARPPRRAQGHGGLLHGNHEGTPAGGRGLGARAASGPRRPAAARQRGRGRAISGALGGVSCEAAAGAGAGSPLLPDLLQTRQNLALPSSSP